MTRHFKHLFRVLHYWLCAFGLDLPSMLATFRAGLRYLIPTFRDYRLLKCQDRLQPYGGKITWSWPCFQNRDSPAGVAQGDYFHQDLLVARRIHARNPVKHVDVGSRIDGFVAHVASFRPIEVFDIRPVHANVPNIIFRQCDFMNPPPDLKNYCDSISCLHALEHFGLGRYGDPVNIQGHADGFRALCSVLSPGGWLYLSVPLGLQRIDFNGHRVFSTRTILDLAEGRLELVDFAHIDWLGVLHESVPVSVVNCDVWSPAYDFGIFEFRKLG